MNGAEINLGVVLRKYRLSRELGVREMAREMKIGFATLSRIENGNGSPDAHTLLRILDWLFSRRVQ